MKNWDIDEVLSALKKLKDRNQEIGKYRRDIKATTFLENQMSQTIAAKVADGIGKLMGEITIDMITEIVDSGKAGIVPKTYFEVWERKVRVGKYHNLEDAVNEYNRRTGE